MPAGSCEHSDKKVSRVDLSTREKKGLNAAVRPPSDRFVVKFSTERCKKRVTPRNSLIWHPGGCSMPATLTKDGVSDDRVVYRRVAIVIKVA